MEIVYLLFVVFFILLAISDLWVGVSNDAVNFMNSAIGSKVAKFRTIVIVAALGILLGSVMSDGMMDIARHGVLRPEMFSFKEVMFIYLAVMATDIILLDTFNSLGMPTSTTVSMVFELLGAAFAFSILKIEPGAGEVFSDYMNTSKALSMIFAIFFSVAVAFIAGLAVQYISRLVFTFQYSGKLKHTIGIFGGLASTSIIYFMLFKGLKHMSFMTPQMLTWLNANTGVILLCCFVVCALLMQVLYWCHVNVFKVIVLMGTFSLATAFAGNDLINFIGVPLSGISSFEYWKEAGAGEPSGFMMDALNGPASTPIWYLIGAGLIMVLALATSKKAHQVTKTEISLAAQEEGEERFGSSKAARSLVRFGRHLAEGVVTLTPRPVRIWIDRRFDNTRIEKEDGAAYDLVRASVNLVVSSLLIALGTSFKLPLSTTYVTFMVAMGTSLADRAWSRESAVYRITGVLSVIGGWFITAGAAFFFSFITALFMHWGDIPAAGLVLVIGIIVMVANNSKSRQQNKKDKDEDLFVNVMKAQDEDEIWSLSRQYVSISQSSVLKLVRKNYLDMTDAMMHEDYRAIKKSEQNLKDIKGQMKNLRKKETLCVRHLNGVCATIKGTSFFTSQNALEQVYYATRRICEPAVEHLDNNFCPMPRKYINEFSQERNLLAGCMNNICTYAGTDSHSNMKFSLATLDYLKGNLSRSLSRLRNEMEGGNVNINMAYVYMNMLQESQYIALQLEQYITSSMEFNSTEGIGDEVSAMKV